MIFADVWAVVGQHALSFLFGLGVGFVLSSRYRIVRAKPPNMQENGNGRG